MKKLVTVLLISLVTSHTHAAATSQDADQLLQHLITAARAGNTNDFLSDLTLTSREAIIAALSGQTALDAAHLEFRAALDQRFGKGPPSKGELVTDDLRAVISRLQALEVLSRKEASAQTMEVVARIQIKTQPDKIASIEQTLTLHQEQGSWKLQAPTPQKDPNLAAVALSACQHTTKELREGRFHDRAAAMVALDRALSSQKEAK